MTIEIRFLTLLALLMGISPHPANAESTFRGMTAVSELTSDYVDLRTFGANFLVFQIASSDNSTPISGDAYNQWLAAKLDALDQVLTVCGANGIKVLVLLYSPPGVLNQSATPARHRLFEDQTLRDQFIQSWQTIATRFRGRPEIYGYDILNEPAVGKIGTGMPKWNSLSQEVLAAIRAIDASVKVVIEPPYGNAEFINKLTRLNDANVAYSIHSYFTSAFRNQGLFGRKINIVYPKPNKKNPKKGFTKKALQASLSKAVTFQRQRKGTQVILGEFAAPRWAPKGSAVRYLRDSINYFERRNWDWANHAWREADVWSPEHSNDPQDSNVSATVTDRGALLKTFFARNSF